ncbi:MAG: ABC transporter permease [Thermomicrobiales bacterium]|nr:ABC transporter permease [Thermomicrobiales bacterium]
MSDVAPALQPGTSSSAPSFALRRPAESASIWLLAWRRFCRHKAGLVGLLVLALEILVAILAPVLIPRELAIDPSPLNILQPPSREHWLGTDEVGRDIFARLIYASRIYLSIGFLAVAVAILVGTTLGALAGYFGGWVDATLMRVTDAILSIPALFFLIVLSVTLGPSVRTMIIVIGLLSWMELARIIRANVLSLKRREFVEAAHTIGARSPQVIMRHILPNTLAPIVVAATLGVGNALLTEASVSYLGLGVQPPEPSWGNMLYNAQSYFFNAPWITLYPGFMILITVLCINFIGDGLRDALDPRMKR